jgi:DNA-binding response OmpR family regulator
MQAIRVTVIDDSCDAARRIMEMLSKECQTEVQHLGGPPFYSDDIEQAIARFNPALLILDLLLFGDLNSGKRVLRELKQSTSLRDVPVIVCSKYITTGKESDQLVKELLELGAAQVLSKVPFPKAEELLKYAKIPYAIRAEHVFP